MQNNKYFIAAIVGGIVYFILGWLVYGMLLMDYMSAHSGLTPEVQAMVNKTPEQFNMWAMILANLSSGFLMATILTWGNFSGFMAGAKAGAIAGLLMAMSLDFIFYGTSNLMGLRAVAADIAAWTAINFIAGGVIGMMLSKGKS